MIDLYTWATPNGRKVSIALEEMGLPYMVHAINIQNDEQLEPEFLKLSPNNKIPAILDNDNSVTVFESGAILTYLAEKSGQFLPVDQPDRATTMAWLNWQIAGFGPMLGQLNHFLNVADEKLPYAIDRFSIEASRLFAVLDHQLLIGLFSQAIRINSKGSNDQKTNEREKNDSLSPLHLAEDVLFW